MIFEKIQAFDRKKNSDQANCNITTWKHFGREVRSKGCNLLKDLDKFPNSVLVTGCQRSGTTMVARIITQSDGMVNYWFGRDDELDAALILSGHVEHTPRGRYCFQTTYVNECYQEYFEHHNGHKIIWILRNPFSVVYSLLHWKRFAFNELFRGCGSPLLKGKKGKEIQYYNLFGKWGISRLHRACLSYNGKVSQAFELVEKINKKNIIVLDYDELIINKKTILPKVYSFIDLDYKDAYAENIHSHSMNKSSCMSNRETAFVESICLPTYLQARKLLSPM